MRNGCTKRGNVGSCRRAVAAAALWLATAKLAGPPTLCRARTAAAARSEQRHILARAHEISQVLSHIDVRKCKTTWIQHT